MRIGLIDVDGGKTFPNIALMKISTWHRARGDNVSWYEPFDEWIDMYVKMLEEKNVSKTDEFWSEI